MGKAAKLKQLRRIASQLPAIQTKQKVSEKILGSHIIDTKEDKDGKPIDPRQLYRRQRIEEVPLNHYKKMKQNYNKAGMAGAAHYAKSVVEYAKQNKLAN